MAAADLALFTRQLATLVQAAMPLETCLQAVSEQSEKLRHGSSEWRCAAGLGRLHPSDSLANIPHVFDSLFCSWLLPEKIRHVDVVLNRLADYTEQRQRLKSRLLQAMLYPLVLLVVATAVVTISLTAVVPKIIEQFDHLGHALPVSTRTLIAMSNGAGQQRLWLAGLLGLLVLGQPTKNPRCACARIKLAAPARDRACCARTEYGTFFPHVKRPHRQPCSATGRRWTAAAVSANRYVEQQLLFAAYPVREGSSLRAALAELACSPDDAVHDHLRRTSGELETMLEQAAVHQEREFDIQVGLALGLFQPALVVMMAGVVLFIVIAILEPMLH
ncbi:type II secretion system F family protein [Escherichia coli]